jgi:hypothetical protein
MPDNEGESKFRTWRSSGRTLPGSRSPPTDVIAVILGQHDGGAPLAAGSAASRVHRFASLFLVTQR